MQSVLEKLGIRDQNPGVFCGEWRGDGAKIDKFLQSMVSDWPAF